MVVGCQRSKLTPKTALLWVGTCTCTLHGSCFCSVCVCFVLFVFQRIKSHTELLALPLMIARVWSAPLFAGAFPLSFRTQTRSPLCRCHSSHPAIHSLSQRLSGLKLFHGEARILRISCQGQARELQGPDCLSKRTSYQSDWTSSAKTSKWKWPSGTRLWPRGLGWRKPSSQRCVRWKHVEPDPPHPPSVSFQEASRQRW